MEHKTRNSEDSEFESLLNELGLGTDNENAANNNHLLLSSEQQVLVPLSTPFHLTDTIPGKKVDWPLQWPPEQLGAAKTANVVGNGDISVSVIDQNSFETSGKSLQHSPSDPQVSDSTQIQKLKKDIKSRDKIIMEMKRLLLEEKELKLARQKQMENHRELLEFKKRYQDLLPVHESLEAEFQRLRTEVEASRASHEQQAAMIQMLKTDIVVLKVRVGQVPAPERIKLVNEIKELKKQIKLQEDKIDDKNRTITKLRNKTENLDLNQITNSDGSDLMKNMMEKIRQIVEAEVKKQKQGDLHSESVLPRAKLRFGHSGSDNEDSESFRVPSRVSSYGDTLAYDGTYSGSAAISLATLSPPSSVENDFIDVHADQELGEVRTKFCERQKISDMEVPSKLDGTVEAPKTLAETDTKSKSRRKKKQKGLEPAANTQTSGDVPVPKADSVLPSLSPSLPEQNVSMTLLADKEPSDVRKSSKPSKPNNLSLPSISSDTEICGSGSQKSIFDIDEELLSPVRTFVDDAVREFFMSPPRVSRSKSQLSASSTSSEEVIVSSQKSAPSSDTSVSTLDFLPELASRKSSIPAANEGKLLRSGRKRTLTAVASDEELCTPEVKVCRLGQTKPPIKSQKKSAIARTPAKTNVPEVNAVEKHIATSTTARTINAPAEKNWSSKRDQRKKPKVADDDSDESDTNSTSTAARTINAPAKKNWSSKSDQRKNPKFADSDSDESDTNSTSTTARTINAPAEKNWSSRRDQRKKPKVADSDSDESDPKPHADQNAKKPIAPKRLTRNSSARAKIGDPTVLLAVGSGERMCLKKRMELLAKQRSGKTSLQLLGKCAAAVIPKISKVDSPQMRTPTTVQEDVRMPEAPAQVDVLPSVTQENHTFVGTVADDLQLSSDDESVSSGSSPRKSSSSTSISSVESFEPNSNVYPPVSHEPPRESDSVSVVNMSLLLETKDDIEKLISVPPVPRPVKGFSRLPLRTRPGTKNTEVDIPTRVKTVPSRIYCTRRSKVMPEGPTPVDESAKVCPASLEKLIDHVEEAVADVGKQPMQMPAHEKILSSSKEVDGSALASASTCTLSAKQRIRKSLPIIAVGSGENVCDKKKLEMMATKTLSLRKKPTDIAVDAPRDVNTEIPLATAGISRTVGNSGIINEANPVVVGMMRGTRAKAVTSQGLRKDLMKIVRPSRTPKTDLTIAPVPVPALQIQEIASKSNSQSQREPNTNQTEFIDVGGSKASFKVPANPGVEYFDQKLLRMLFSKEAKTIDVDAFVQELSGVQIFEWYLPPTDYLAKRLYDHVLHEVLDYAMQKIDEKVLVRNSQLLGRKLQWVMSAHKIYEGLNMDVASFFICEVLNKEQIFQRDDILNGIAISYGTLFKFWGLKKVAYEALFVTLLRHVPKKYAFSQGFLSAFPDVYTGTIPRDSILQRGILLALLCAPLYADSIYHNNVRDILRDGLGQQVEDMEYKTVVLSLWNTSKDLEWSHTLMDLEKTLAMLLIQCRWSASLEAMEDCFTNGYSSWCRKEISDAVFGSLLNSFVWATELHGSKDSGTERVLKLFDTVIQGKHTGITSRLYRIVETGKNKLITSNKSRMPETQSSSSTYCSHQSMLEQKKTEAKEGKKARKRVKQKIRKTAKKKKGQQAEVSQIVI